MFKLCVFLKSAANQQKMGKLCENKHTHEHACT